jgi:Uncharacterised protein family (UPF0104).
VRRPLLHAAQAAIAAGLLVLLWHLADGAAMLEHLAQAHPGWLAAAVAALTAQTVLSALRWRLTADRMGITLDGNSGMPEYYL